MLELTKIYNNFIDNLINNLINSLKYRIEPIIYSSPKNIIFIQWNLKYKQNNIILNTIYDYCPDIMTLQNINTDTVNIICDNGNYKCLYSDNIAIVYNINRFDQLEYNKHMLVKLYDKINKKNIYVANNYNYNYSIDEYAIIGTSNVKINQNNNINYNYAVDMLCSHCTNDSFCSLHNNVFFSKNIKNIYNYKYQSDNIVNNIYILANFELIIN